MIDQHPLQHPAKIAAASGGDGGGERTGGDAMPCPRASEREEEDERDRRRAGKLCGSVGSGGRR